jgi:hypothetical protein
VANQLQPVANGDSTGRVTAIEVASDAHESDVPRNLVVPARRGKLDNDAIRILLSELNVSNLDAIPNGTTLGSAFGLKGDAAENKTLIAKLLVVEGLLSPELPEGHPISKKGGSRYVNPEVVGQENVVRNAGRWVRGEQKQGRITNLDEVPKSPILAIALGVAAASAENRSLIAKALIEKELLSPDLPEGYSISQHAGTRYLDPEVVGKEKVLENIARWIKREQQQGRYTNLDNIPQSWALGVAFGLHPAQATDRTLIAKKLIEHRLISAELPEGHSIAQHAGSRYVNPEIVGKPKASENLARWVRHEQSQGRITNLDEIPKLRFLGTALGLTESSAKNQSLIAKALITSGLLSPDLPDGHSISKSGGSRYVDAEVVGKAKALENFDRWVRFEQSQGRITSLDDIPRNSVLDTVLTLEGISSQRQNRALIAKALIARELLSPFLPEGHSISKNGGTRYFDTEVLSEPEILDNVRRSLQSRHSFVEELVSTSPSNRIYCAALGCDSPQSLRILVQSLGWLPCRDDSVFSVLPPEFSNRDRSRVPKKTISGLGTVSEELVRNRRREITFVKGEAFEQLVGLFIALESPQERLLPQFCLDVDPSNRFFGVRADWKIGARIVEVKFGRADQNIRSTVEKHQSYLGKRDDLSYQVITLIDRELPDLQTTSFGDLVQTIADEDAKLAFLRITDLIKDLEVLEDERSLRKMQLIRDTLYTVTEQLSSKIGPARVSIIKDVLEAVSSCSDEDLFSKLSMRSVRAYNGIAATFEYQGKLYKSQIQIPAYAFENGNKDRFSIVYLFGEERFVNAEDRDMSVLLEGHLGKRVEKFIRNPGALHSAPIFEIEPGIFVSRHVHRGVQTISEEAQLIRQLSIEPDWVEFAHLWVSTLGRSA